MKVRPDVEQDEEVDAAPGAQEGQDWRRWRGGQYEVGGGGVEGKKGEAAVKQSFFSGSGVTEGGEESRCCTLRLVLVLREVRQRQESDLNKIWSHF